MTLPAFADLEAFGARIPGGIPSDEEARAQAALDDASVRIRAEAGKTWTTTTGEGEEAVTVVDFGADAEARPWVPDAIASMTMRAAQRSYANPDGLSQEATGEWSASTANASSDVYLTKSERELVAKAVGRSGVWVQPTTRGKPEMADTEFLDVEPVGEKIPWDVSPQPF